MVGLIVSIIVIGLLAGALARLEVPGTQDISNLMTIVVGIVGSFVAGFLGYLIFHQDPQDGFLPALRNHRRLHRSGHRDADLDQRRQAPRRPSLKSVATATAAQVSLSAPDP